MKKSIMFAVFAFSILLIGSLFVLAENESSDVMKKNETRDRNESFMEVQQEREERRNETRELKEQERELKNETRQLREQEKDLREQIRELKEKEKEYRHEGRNISVRELNDSQLQIITDRINARTGLNLTVEEVKNGSIFRTLLSNGREAEIKFLPDRAAERAREVLGAKCEERNCTLELKEVGKGNETRLAYELKTEKDSKFLFLFKAKRPITANIDAESGNVTDIRGPWWSFLAKDQN